MRKKSRYRPLKIGDFGIILFFLSALFFLPRIEGRKVRITVDKGKEYIYSLTEDRVLLVRGQIGVTKVVIKDGRVRVLEAPCPLKLCRQKGWIKKKGDQIICIPNGILIRIEGERFDAITE